MNTVIHLDYRSVFGQIRDQGPRPTCLSFAATAAHEYVRRSRESLSPEYLHYFASARGKSNGVQFSDVARALENPGQPTEIDCPYRGNDPPPGWMPPKSIRLYRRKNELKGANVEHVSTLLNAGHVPVMGITVPQRFYSPSPPWLISPDGPIRGLHAVVAVALGSLGDTRCFLIRNSWGSDWGDNGHAWIDDTFVEKHLYHLLALTDEVT